MARFKPLTWNLCIAGLSLSAAIAVYCFARLYPPEILTPFQAFNNELSAHTNIFESAPAFFYTLSLCLVISAFASTQAGARLHSIIWIGLALALEFTQHPVLAEPLSIWLESSLTESAWSLFGPYWIRGVFDPVDLIASLAGGITALALVTHLSMEKTHANS